MDQFPDCEFDDAYANLGVWTQPGPLFVFEDAEELRGPAAVCERMFELCKGNRGQFILQILQKSRGETILLKIVTYRIFIENFPRMVENNLPKKWVEQTGNK